MAAIRYISAIELQQMYDKERLVICDIREVDEYNREHIIGAINMPLSSFDVSKVNQLSSGKQIVIHCQSGNRTKLSETKFQNLACSEVLILEGGIGAWKKLGCALVVNNKAPLPIMRQVQIVAGSLVLIGVVLGFVVSPWFYLLSGFVGAGLLFAGISGFCGMANILMLLPYNKNNGCNSSCSK